MERDGVGKDVIHKRRSMSKVMRAKKALLEGTLQRQDPGSRLWKITHFCAILGV